MNSAYETLARCTSNLKSRAVSCDQQPVEPQVNEVSAAESGALFSATTTTSNIMVPISDAGDVPCANGGAGEEVLITGTLHILSHTTTDNRGGSHTKFHFQPQGITGVGQSTGDTYRATGVSQGTTNVVGLPSTDTYVNIFQMIGPGPGNNFMVHEVFHTTINANGEVTSVVANSRVECK
jgi:hypothetical protein